MYLTSQEIEQIREFFRNQPVQKAYLFGSYARGDADAGSDVDLLVELDYERLVSAMDFFSWHEYLAKILGKKVDVISPSRRPSRFKENIQADLTLVYEAQAA